MNWPSKLPLLLHPASWCGVVRLVVMHFPFAVWGIVSRREEERSASPLPYDDVFVCPQRIQQVPLLPTKRAKAAAAAAASPAEACMLFLHRSLDLNPIDL